ncbi:hypothetical protein AB0K14_17790 [Actinosynnema sp. NPDC050801]|uniref:hypothetical protein n=1 Tax=unclassified Actinosynnema TaxID=2637065 RepID=UPI003403DC0A
MQKTWEISGAAANWTMTVSILEPEDAADAEGTGGTDLSPPDGPDPLRDFEGLVEHFRTLVDLTEALWQLRQVG